MSRLPLPTGPLLLVPLLLASACSKFEVVEFEYPKGEYSALTTDFGAVNIGSTSTRSVWFKNAGELPMGIGGVRLGEGDKSDQFTVVYYDTEVECPGGGSQAEAKDRATLDSGGLPPKDTAEEDTGDDSPDAASELVLDPGCRFPLHITYSPSSVGDVWGSVIVTTVTEDVGDAGDPAYYADRIKTRHMAMLSGEGMQAVPNVVVNPYTIDFGNVWVGESDIQYVSIKNTGSAVLNLTDPTFDAACSSAYAVLDSTTTLKPQLAEGESTFIKVQFTPVDTRSAECRLTINSDDPDAPRIDVNLKGNTSEDTENRAPTVVIRHPYNGYQHKTDDDLVFELNLFDVNQPATSLDCRVKSMIVNKETITECVPGDESGHVYVSVPVADFKGKVDTLKIQVSDSASAQTEATVSVLFNAAYPDSDDDGDGWGETPDADGYFDMDDTNVYSYPEAAEVADDHDNNGDGTVDEGTTNYDDDGDVLSEAAGDCNDLDPTIFPGATELSDHKDNDCDGATDEGTVNADEDGDGYAENDCDAENPNVHPGATDYCDGMDNDCNGLIDDSCIELDPKPYVVGGISMQQTSCEEGDRITVSVMAFDPYDANLDYAWTGDSGLTIDPISGSSTVTLTCPETNTSSVKSFGFYVIVTDHSAQQDWEYDDILVYPKGDLYVKQAEVVPVQGGTCSAVGGAPVLAMGLGALLASLLRRRSR